MNRMLPAAAMCLALAASLPLAAQAAAKSHAKPAATAKKAALAKAEEAPETLTDGQLAAADRVFTGRADCEFKQTVDVEPVNGQPGHFNVHFGKQQFHMVPEETTTGAVRLHDRKADVVWLQIPAKSMLMNNKAGQRMVDACMHPQQRTAAAGSPGVAAAALVQ